jgi:hypothetical protein
VLVAVFLIACVLLYIHADDTPEPVWNHWIKIFEALGPMVGLALGWVFGKEVHRKAAESAIRKADHGSELAGVVRQALGTERKVLRMTATEPTADTSGDVASLMSSHLESLADQVERLFPQ